MALASKITVTVSGPWRVTARAGSISVREWRRTRPPETTDTTSSLSFVLHEVCVFLMLDCLFCLNVYKEQDVTLIFKALKEKY